jgi:hypothetical protein
VLDTNCKSKTTTLVVLLVRCPVELLEYNVVDRSFPQILVSQSICGYNTVLEYQIVVDATGNSHGCKRGIAALDAAHTSYIITIDNRYWWKIPPISGDQIR